MSADDYDAMMETLDILSDRETMVGLREADEEIARGELIPLDEVEAVLRARGIID